MSLLHVFVRLFIIQLKFFIVLGLSVGFYVLWKIWDSFSRRNKGSVTIGIYHPFCNDCGGGERVLWCAIKVLESIELKKPLHIAIYTVDDSPRELIFRNVREKFGITLSPDFQEEIEFVFVDCKSYLDPKSYPIGTMVGQSLGAVYLSFKCLEAVVPDIFLDTQGSAFSYLLPRLFTHCCILSYTHYPIISQVMIDKVRSREIDYNNRSLIANTLLGTQVKLTYYQLFMWIYQLAGSCAEGIMSNGTWTKNHVDHLFQLKYSWKLYPPCDVSFFSAATVDVRHARHLISIGQFRPEKDHNKQLEILSLLLHYYKSEESEATPSRKNRFPHVPKDLKLIVVGGARNAEDQERVVRLQQRADALGIQEHVQFEIGVHRMIALMSQSLIGIHTMRNEHFGISVVELQASGLVTVANRSAGPELDIIEEGKTGFLCNDAEDYAQKIDEIFALQESEPEKLEELQKSAKQNCLRFSQEAFGAEFTKIVTPFLQRYL